MVKVLVTSGAGYIGAATLSALARDVPDADVTVTSRGGPSGASADKIRQSLPSATVVSDSDTQAALASSAAEVVIIIPPGAEDRAEIAERWIQAIAADSTSTVRHVILISVPFTSRAELLFQRQFAKAEAALSALDARHVTFTVLQLDFFLDNTYGFAPGIKASGKVYFYLGEDGWFSGTSTADVGSAIATIVSTPQDERAARFGGKTYVLTSNERNTGKDVARVITEVTGGAHQFEYVNVTDGEAVVQGCQALGMPEWQARGVLELFVMFASKRGPEPSGHFKEITGREPQTLKEVLGAWPAAFL